MLMRMALRLGLFWLFGFVVTGWQFSESQTAPTRYTRYFVTAPLHQLRRLGLQPEVGQHGMGFVSLGKQTLSLVESTGIPLQIKEIGEIPVNKVFLSPSDITKQMQQLQQSYPKLVELVNLNRRFHTPLTYEGRALYALRIRHPIDDRSPRPVVLLDSLHHSRELITPLVTMGAASTLLSQFQNDPEVTRWLTQAEIWIVPIVNPDGYHYVFTKEPFWRKNRRVNADASVGVDLNRNYPYLWGACGKNSSDGSSEVYKGKVAGSEPEIQTMLALGRALRPSLYLTYHSYGNEVLRPYMCRQSAEDAWVQAMTNALATTSGYGSRKASSSGESFEHFYHQFGSFSFLVEVGSSFQPDPQSVPGLLSRASTTWKELMRRGLSQGLSARVTNDKGVPVEASYQLEEIQFTNGEKRISRKQDGFFYWSLPVGRYHLVVKASGFRVWRRQIVIQKGEVLSVDVQLEALPDACVEPVRSESPSTDSHGDEPIEPSVSSREVSFVGREFVGDASVGREVLVDGHLDGGGATGADAMGPRLPEQACACSGSRLYRPGIMWLFVLFVVFLWLLAPAGASDARE
jgi:hypothetical protein